MEISGICLGTDSGATTSKTGGIFADGPIISHQLRQCATNSPAGTAAVVRGWVEGANGFLAEHKLTWAQVRGAGLAIPGRHQRTTSRSTAVTDRRYRKANSREGLLG